MRLFLGIDLSEENKKQLYQSLVPLRTKHPEFMWLEPKNYHITLHFFGEATAPKEVAKRLEDILYDAPSFYLYALNMDIFVRKNLLLYLSYYREKKLEKIVKTVRRDLDLDEKASFLPHTTLSRSSLSSKQQYYALKNEIEKMKSELEVKVDTIYLFESIITGKQPIYNKIAKFKLITP